MRKPKWLKNLQSKFEKFTEEYEKELRGSKQFEDCLSCSRKEESSLNLFRDAAHANAIDKGFYDCTLCEGSGYGSDGIECCHCDNGKVRNFNFPQMIALIHGEASEALEADRKGKSCNVNKQYFQYNQALSILETDFDPEQFEKRIKNTVEDELADIVIRVFDTCGYLGIDLDWHVKEKMKYNKTREAKHGKRY